MNTRINPTTIEKGREILNIDGEPLHFIPITPNSLSSHPTPLSQITDETISKRGGSDVDRLFALEHIGLDVELPTNRTFVLRIGAGSRFYIGRVDRQTIEKETGETTVQPYYYVISDSDNEHEDMGGQRSHTTFINFFSPGSQMFISGSCEPASKAHLDLEVEFDELGASVFAPKASFKRDLHRTVSIDYEEPIVGGTADMSQHTIPLRIRQLVNIHLLGASNGVPAAKSHLYFGRPNDEEMQMLHAKDPDGTFATSAQRSLREGYAGNLFNALEAELGAFGINIHDMLTILSGEDLTDGAFEAQIEEAMEDYRQQIKRFEEETGQIFSQVDVEQLFRRKDPEGRALYNRFIAVQEPEIKRMKDQQLQRAAKALVLQDEIYRLDRSDPRLQAYLYGMEILQAMREDRYAYRANTDGTGTNSLETYLPKVKAA